MTVIFNVEYPSFLYINADITQTYINMHVYTIILYISDGLNNPNCVTII